VRERRHSYAHALTFIALTYRDPASDGIYMQYGATGFLNTLSRPGQHSQRSPSSCRRHHSHDLKYEFPGGEEIDVCGSATPHCHGRSPFLALPGPLAPRMCFADCWGLRPDQARTQTGVFGMHWSRYAHLSPPVDPPRPLQDRQAQVCLSAPSAGKICCLAITIQIRVDFLHGQNAAHPCATPGNPRCILTKQ
jgi:hypothetical protein